MSPGKGPEAARTNLVDGRQPTVKHDPRGPNPVQRMTRLIHPVVLLFSPFTIQLAPGYDTPTTELSTALPTSSSFV